ncbi:MAG: glycosyltransferase family 4 protein [Thermoleophilaceae bacterium]|nr:glycosyltransferase family 4 protein [Thermoleophilaceae bacterium]
MRTLAVFHIAETSGPSKTLFPSLERLAARGSLEAVVPVPGGGVLPGTVAADYAGFATVSALPYATLMVPRTLGALVREPARCYREVTAFRRHFRTVAPDLVVVATGVLPTALIAARLESIPTIVRVAEIFEKGHVGGIGRRVGSRALLALLQRTADAIVCSSEQIAAQFRAPVTTIWPGIDPVHGDGDGARLRATLGVTATDPLIAVVGNITEARGQDLAIAALVDVRRRHRSARLLIAGAAHDRPADAAYAERLHDLAEAEQLADAVLFGGFIGEVADVYAAADVLLNPARFNEPFGRVALEGLLAGCPVVSTRVGAIPSVLRADDDALLVPPEDPAAIAAALTRLLDDRELAAQMAERGRARVLRDFGTQRVADEFEQVARSITPVTAWE